MLAYRKQMKHMLDEGHQTRHERHREMAEYTRDWAREQFGLFPEEGYESQTVTCVENTRGINVAETVEQVSEEYDMVFSSGYGSIGEESFRIGHMGEHTVESIEALTDAIEDVADL
jgi:aspartate aminotransferase-like enzyme